jgi:hypothetical protein
MSKIRKLLVTPIANRESARLEYNEFLKASLIESTRILIRSAFDKALIDTTALACIKVAIDLGFTELANEMLADYGEVIND